ncbi:unnamed protein product [Arabidopsis lyrata]|nr:unnamed protein product [Arabidopsis lyrata]
MCPVSSNALCIEHNVQKTEMSDQGTDLSWTTSELKTQPNSPTNGDQDGVEVNPHRALLEFTLFELNQAVTHASASSDWADAAVLSPSEYILIDDQQNLQLETQDRLALIAVMAKVAAAAAKLAASAALQAKLFAEDAIPKSDDIFKSAKLATEAISLAGIFVSTCCVNKLVEAEESLKRLTVDALVPDAKLKDMGDTSLAEGPVVPATILSEVKKEMKPSDVNACDRAEDCKSSKIQLENMSKSQPGSKTEKADQIVADTKFKDVGDTSLPDGGPVEPATPLSEVKQEPYNLPSPYEWTTCDMNSDDMCSAVYNFLKEQFPDKRYLFQENYSREFLRWALCPPGYHQSWHIGVRAKNSTKLAAFISGVPERIRVHDKVVEIAKITLFCIHKKLRMLNPMKLMDVRFSCALDNTTAKRLTVKLYNLPDATITPGFRKMEQRDVPAVTGLLRNYLSQFGVATDFDENDIEHWFLPREHVIYSYVVETHDVITDLCSFYAVQLTIDDNNPKHETVECAYSYYNVATQTSLLQLMKDALIVSKKEGFDVFYALDVMHNESFLKDLKFKLDDSQMHYYLYNYRLRSALKPSEFGIVF